MIALLTGAAWFFATAYAIGLSDSGQTRADPLLVGLLNWGFVGIPVVGIVAAIAFVIRRNRK